MINTLSRGEKGKEDLPPHFASSDLLFSPFPPLPDTKFPPLKEFVTQNWTSNGGHLGEKVAIIDGSTGLTRTFDEYYAILTSVGAALHDMGVGKDSTVALFSPNHVDYLPVSLAVSLCGAKLTPINPLFTGNELLTILDRSRSSVLIVHKSKLDVGLETAKASQHVKQVIVMTDDDDESVPEGTIHLSSLKGFDGALRETPKFVHDAVETHSFLLPYSSGTTGLPKGVCLTHRNLIVNLLQCEAIEGPEFAEVSHMILNCYVLGKQAC